LSLQAGLSEAHQGALLTVKHEAAAQVEPLADVVAIEQPQPDASQPARRICTATACHSRLPWP
jgi:hypothetical protein